MADLIPEIHHPETYQDYKTDFGVRADRSKVAVLDDGETISSIVNITPLGSLGVTVDSVTNTPQIVSDGASNAARALRFWVSVDPTYQANSAWDDGGQIELIECKITTSSGRTIAKNVGLKVAR